MEHEWTGKNVYLTKQEDRVVLMKGFSMLEKTFLNIYDTDFKKEIFPIEIVDRRASRADELGRIGG